MSEVPSRTARDPAFRGSNIRLGLIIAGVVVILAAAAVIRFTVFGLPVSKTEYERLQQQRSGFQPETEQLQGSEP